MSDHDHEEFHSHAKLYFAVFIALCVFTAISVLADVVNLGNKNLLRVIVMSVATAKALCVMLYFMHLKFERAWKYLLLAPTLILAAAIPFALMPDMVYFYYPQESPQIYEYERMEAEGLTENQGHGH